MVRWGLRTPQTLNFSLKLMLEAKGNGKIIFAAQDYLQMIEGKTINTHERKFIPEH